MPLLISPIRGYPHSRYEWIGHGFRRYEGHASRNVLDGNPVEVDSDPLPGKGLVI